MVATDTPQEEGATPIDVVEKRVGQRVIRRRKRKADEVPPPQEAAPEAAAGAASPDEAATTAVSAEAGAAGDEASTETSTPEPASKTAASAAPKTPGAAKREAASAKPDEAAAAKAKKLPRKKMSKAEWVEDDIRRAGGLQEFAAQHLVVDEEAESPAEANADPEAPAREPAQAPAAPITLEKKVATPATPLKPIVTPRVERVFRPTGMRRKRSLRGRGGKKTQITEMKASKRIIRIEEEIAVGDLSQRLGVKANELIHKLMELEIAATINQTIDIDTAALLATEYGFEVESVAINEEALLSGMAQTPAAGEEGAEPVVVAAVGDPRPPVVTVMGHVDHGKTSILDAIRKTDIASGEAGGITQHIGTSEVSIEKGTISFIDTPGHAAFTALRARGAQVTDIVILVVAADDGVMPQTREAIDHAKAGDVPIIVAMNKMDLADANPDRIKRQLSENGLVIEEWGGEVPCVSVSAKTGDGIQALLELILLQAEVLELRADANQPAAGTVLEARLDKGRGPVATVLVQAGSLRKGSPLVCGTAFGRVRALIDSHGQTVQAVTPGHGVEVVGLNSVPTAGDPMYEAADEKAAKTVATSRERKERQAQQGGAVSLSLEDLQAQLMAGQQLTFPIIVKGDVHGSVEAVVAAIERLGTDAIQVKVMLSGVGGVTESDILLAKASEAMVIGFNVAPETKVRRLAEQEKVTVKRYGIIYELIDDVKSAMAGRLEPTREEKVMGSAAVREVFNISKVGTIAGCSVSDGRISRAHKARLVRDSVVVFEGEISSLKRFKDDAKEVQEGHECGIGLTGFHDVKPGDVIEAYIVEETAAVL